ncbi:MAG TPA: beta-propeller fold lactonase family protein [Steroidobacteraceae bacterium]|nr:beta-propeller fold lactonase family protein [Steroidobacteraceae bacterium]
MYATTNAGQILKFPLRTPPSIAPTSIAGPANSSGMAVVSVPNLPQSPYLFVSDPGANAIRIYNVSAIDGELSEATASPFLVGGTPGGMTSIGTLLYVATSAGSIEALNVNADGSLSRILGSPFTAGSGLTHLAAISSFSVSGASFVYAANTEDPNGSISAFTIEASGALEPIPGSPFSTVPNGGPAGFYGGGKFLYVALKNANAVAAFAIADNGSLTPIAGSPFAAGQGTFSLAGADGFLFAINNSDGTISSYSMNPSTGALTAVTGSPFAGSVASGDTLYVDGLFFVPSAQFESIDAFGFDSAGAVQTLNASSFKATSGPVALASVFFPVIDPP